MKRGRKPATHRAVHLHIGTLALKPTLYPAHQTLLEALQKPVGMSRKQKATQLMLAGLTGAKVADTPVAATTDDGYDDSFLNV